MQVFGPNNTIINGARPKVIETAEVIETADRVKESFKNLLSEFIKLHK